MRLGGLGFFSSSFARKLVLSMAAARSSSSALSTVAASPASPWKPAWSAVRGVFVGSGIQGMQTPEVRDAIMRLAGEGRKQRANGGGDVGAVEVVYLGTATYDDATAREKQTQTLIAAGASVKELAVAGDVGGAGQLSKVRSSPALFSCDTPQCSFLLLSSILNTSPAAKELFALPRPPHLLPVSSSSSQSTH